VAQLLKDQVRGIDCPARWGGEEFLIMLIETDMEGGLTVAERIRSRLEKTTFDFDGATLPPVTMTFGLSQYQGANDTLDSCIKRADKALYAGKAKGKNTVVNA
jgi:diguanylate cyclase (GGDEF)-like protein